jgi:DNA-binding XRE family transcriptional regulator
VSTYGEAVVELLLRRFLDDPHFDAATDEEIADLIVVASPSNFKWPAYDRRLLVERVADRRRTDAGNQPTAYAREKIAEIRKAYPEMKRRTRSVSKSAMATRVGVHRETITDWAERGWLTWPPKNPRL